MFIKYITTPNSKQIIIIDELIFLNPVSLNVCFTFFDINNVYSSRGIASITTTWINEDAIISLVNIPRYPNAKIIAIDTIAIKYIRLITNIFLFILSDRYGY